ncbi:MAG: ABC transporter ATP-binding protein [Oceanospirillaceae bacterium]|jgi:ATP-binding cassette, subfamily B, multidrug efflux pump|nr:ABC transporter ATP-binding protein [Oceanospirillaceae bacterium]MBT4444148.1 ABC transporter ATP-binding protein [Oceanospirillaceae bacterium]MBT6077876.1 ABC transporter ATP-binding protein [Oceanospirillaceae bacterium]
MFKFFENLVNPYPRQAPAQPPNNVWNFCLHYCDGMKRYMLILALSAGAFAAMEIVLFGFVAQLVDWLAVQNKQTFLADQAVTLWTMSGLLLIGMPIIILINNLMRHQTLIPNLTQRVRWMAHGYLLRQSMEFYQDDFAGRIAAKVMQGALAVRQIVSKLCDTFFYVLVGVISMLLLLTFADWRMAMPLVAWIVAFSIALYYFLPRLRNVSEDQANKRAIMTGRVVDSYTNITTVKLFAHTQSEARYAKSSMDLFLRNVFQMMRLSTGMDLTITLINNMLIFSTATLNIYLWLNGDVSLGMVAVSLALAMRLQSFSDWLMWEIHDFFESIGTVIDAMNTISQPQQVVDHQPVNMQVSQGQIDFNNIDFRYGKQEGVIESLSLSIKAGEKVGIVGRSGAGKSTLVNLLMRFYDLENGNICIDGQDISQVSQDSLRAVIGMVTQDTSLLHRSVRENIVYGKPDATDAELLDACKKAEADVFIETLQDPKGNKGYMAQVGERGVKLSGGQRQRIAIARVLLKNAPILVLDEATSALDSEVEAAIQASLNRLMEGKTVIAIAHRLSTIAAMDRLVIIDEGRIIEQGSHQELLLQDGIYAKLWQHQTGGFIGLD